LAAQPVRNTVAEVSRRLSITLCLVTAAVAGAAMLLVSGPDRPTTGPTDPTELIPLAMGSCQADTERLMSVCVADTLLSARLDPAQLVSVLYEWNRVAPEHGTLCHHIAHYLGRSLVADIDPVELVPLDTGRCDGGLVHGVVEGLALSAEDAAFEASVSTVCDGFEVGTNTRHECVHGVGHALTLRYPGPFIEMAHECTILEDHDQNPCYTAVLMAYSTDSATLAEEVVVPVPRLAPDEISTVCTKVPETMVVKCWEGIWQLYPREPWEVLVPLIRDACIVAEQHGWERWCAMSLGQMLVQREPRPSDAPGLLTAARVARSRCPSGELYLACLEGVASTTLTWYVALHGSDSGYASLCDHLGGDELQACRDGEAGIRGRVAERRS
jgi:hypothetical protein